jgi:hypothetical protein
MTAFEKGSHEQKSILAEYGGTQRENKKSWFSLDRHFGSHHNCDAEPVRAAIFEHAGFVK